MYCLVAFAALCASPDFGTVDAKGKVESSDDIRIRLIELKADIESLKRRVESGEEQITSIALACAAAFLIALAIIQSHFTAWRLHRRIAKINKGKNHGRASK